jgi:hypothetical protein
MNGRKVGAVIVAAAGLSAAAWAVDPQPLPPVVVKDRALKEETAVGPYKQPEWTMSRRFPTTRVYVQQPPGGVAAEQWVRTRVTDGKAKHRVQEEVEIGLPHRLQLDLYYNWTIDSVGVARQEHVAVELRYALADWGVIPLNPTLYAEYKFADPESDISDVVEAKALLGEEVSAAWHWGLNLVYERELTGEKAEEWAASQAVSYSAVDRKFGIGAEMKYVQETVVAEGMRGAAEHKLLLGPSVQWRPAPNVHLDVAPLFGLTPEAPDMESYLVLGVDFGPANEKARGPVSLKSN